MTSIMVHLSQVEAERDQLRQQVEKLLGAAREVAEAHRSVIEAVTPGHPNALPPGPMQGEKKDEYDARFSRWHSTTRSLRAAVADFDDQAADQVRKELEG